MKWLCQRNLLFSTGIDVNGIILNCSLLNCSSLKLFAEFAFFYSFIFYQFQAASILKNHGVFFRKKRDLFKSSPRYFFLQHGMTITLIISGPKWIQSNCRKKSRLRKQVEGIGTFFYLTLTGLRIKILLQFGRET